MRIHELFQRLDPEATGAIVGYFRDQERDMYRATLANLAAQRNLRPVFLQRKKAADQIAWMVKTLRLPSSADIGEQLLQAWLLKARADMLKQFLDGIDVAHDGNGAVDDLPETLDAGKVNAAVAGLLESYPAHEVAIYLHMFQRQSSGGWAEVQQLLDHDPRLALTEAPASSGA